MFHDELAEFLGRLEIRVGDEVHRHHGSFRRAERREVVVLRQRLLDVRRRDAERGHPVGLQPYAHRERAAAKDVGALHAAHGGELRLHHACQVIGDLVLIELAGGEAEIHRRELRVRGLKVDDRRLRLGRQVVAHLRDLRLDLGERGIGVVVQLQMDGDRRDALRAGRLDVVDAVSAGDDPLERRRNEAADEVGVRAHVDGRHLDDRDVAARELPHGERPDGLQSGDQDDEVDDDREDRTLDEEVGEFHKSL